MPKRIGMLFFGKEEKELRSLCKEKNLNEYETEIIIRIYWKKQSITYISDTMDFTKYGKNQKLYSTRSINTFHKEAFIKLMK